MNSPEKYVVVSKKKFERKSLLEIYHEAKGQKVWSGRIATGILGFPDCPSGKRGPAKEVLFGIGDAGLISLIGLGFIPCPVCKPDKTPGFAHTIGHTVRQKFHLNGEEFADKDKLDYNAGRLAWRKIFAMTENRPGRIYLANPQKMNKVEVLITMAKLKLADLTSPRSKDNFETKVGFYDHSKPSHFTQYFQIG